jgi:succinate--hydroxymethylglutarate CoA-transferase
MKQNLLLKGFRVIDFSRILVGAYSSLLLADMGAEVIKIEPPNGDETREWGPPFKDKDSTYFLSINRNKKSISLDLKKQEAQEIAKELIKKSDILIENFPYGKMKNFNIDYENTKLLKKDLIYATVNSYGNEGPMRKDPAFDLIIQAYSGIMNITGGKNTEPFKVGYPMCDIMTGSHLFSAILAAVLHKERTGEGQYLNTSLLEVNLFSNPTIVSAFLNGDINSIRKGNDHPSISPYSVFMTKSNEYFTIGVATDKQFKKLWEILKLNKTSDFSLFSNNELRIENREKLKKLIQDNVLIFDENDLFILFKNEKIPFSKINSMKDLFGDYYNDKTSKEENQIKALDMVKNVDTENFGNLKYVRNPITFEKIDLKDIESPPKFGENTKEILSNLLKYDEEKINKLYNDKIIF